MGMCFRCSDLCEILLVECVGLSLLCSNKDRSSGVNRLWEGMGKGGCFGGKTWMW
jgi:hypothetical protein